MKAMKEKMDIVADGNCVSICIKCKEIRRDMCHAMGMDNLPPLPKCD